MPGSAASSDASSAGDFGIGSEGGEGVSGSRTRRGDLTRARILDAARVAFQGVGWDRTRVEDVCREAGIGHGTFYSYYANKTAVVEALVRRHAAALYRLAEQPWTSGDVRAYVQSVIAGFVAVSESDRDLREIWLTAAASEATLRELIDEVRRQFVSRVRTNLAAAVDAGVARDGLDVDVVATALAAMVEHTVALVAGEVDRQRLVGTLTDLWVAAVYR